MKVLPLAERLIEGVYLDGHLMGLPVVAYGGRGGDALIDPASSPRLPRNCRNNAPTHLEMVATATMTSNSHRSPAEGSNAEGDVDRRPPPLWVPRCSLFERAARSRANDDCHATDDLNCTPLNARSSSETKGPSRSSCTPSLSPTQLNEHLKAFDALMVGICAISPGGRGESSVGVRLNESLARSLATTMSLELAASLRIAIAQGRSVVCLALLRVLDGWFAGGGPHRPNQPSRATIAALPLVSPALVALARGIFSEEIASHGGQANGSGGNGVVVNDGSMPTKRKRASATVLLDQHLSMLASRPFYSQPSRRPLDATTYVKGVLALAAVCGLAFRCVALFVGWII